MNEYINKILELADEAYKNDDVPIGAIVVYNNEIIGEGYNQKNKTNKVIDHAEIIAINQASEYLKDWRLDDCSLYVTLEPCQMCKEVIRQSRIKEVFYLVPSSFYNENNREINYIRINNNSDEYKNKLSTFFKDKR